MFAAANPNVPCQEIDSADARLKAVSSTDCGSKELT